MALKLIQRLPSLGQARIQHYPAVGLLSTSRSWSVAGPPCVVRPGTTASSCLLRPGPWQLQAHWGRMGLSTAVRDPFCVAVGSVGLHQDPQAPQLLLTQLHCPSDAEEQAFHKRLTGCSSSQHVFKLLRSMEILSDTMAAAALHAVAHLEDGGHCLKDATVLENDAIKAICFQLEQDSERLTDGGLVSALLACTRLFLDPRSSLVVRLVSESRERLDRGVLSAGALCSLGRAMLALEGPGSATLEQVMEQIQKQGPAQWSLEDLTAVYTLLQDGAAEDGKYQELLNAMHAHSVSLTPRMDPPAVSRVLAALVALNQSQAIPLVIKLCKQAARHVPHFSDQELASVLTALMHFGHSSQSFVDAMEKHVPTMAFTSDPETVTKVMQFFSRRNILSPPVFDAVAESFVYRAGDYSTTQLAWQIIPFGKLGYLPPNAADVFRKVENVLHTRFYHFQPRTLLNLLHSCILVERFPVNFVSKVFSSFFLQQLQGEGMDRITLAQLTQLYMTVKLECPFYQGPQLHPKYRVNHFLTRGKSLETPVDGRLYNLVKNGLVDLLGAREYFGSKVLTPHCYTLDVELKLDEDGYVLPASQNDDIHKRIALCIDGEKRFSTNTTQLLGKEAIKQRHLRLLGYQVVQIPYYEFEQLQTAACVVEYLHRKVFAHSFRLSWR